MNKEPLFVERIVRLSKGAGLVGRWLGGSEYNGSCLHSSVTSP